MQFDKTAANIKIINKKRLIVKGKTNKIKEKVWRRGKNEGLPGFI
jgi:hypothetical protein